MIRQKLKSSRIETQSTRTAPLNFVYSREMGKHRGRVLSVAKCLSWPRGKCNGQQERKDTGQDSSPRDVSAKVQGPLRQPQCLRCGSADDDSLSSMEGVERGWGGHWAVSFNRGRTLWWRWHGMSLGVLTSPWTRLGTCVWAQTCTNRMPRGAVSNEGQQSGRISIRWQSLLIWPKFWRFMSGPFSAECAQKCNWMNANT